MGRVWDYFTLNFHVGCRLHEIILGCVAKSSIFIVKLNSTTHACLSQVTFERITSFGVRGNRIVESTCKNELSDGKSS